MKLFFLCLAFSSLSVSAGALNPEALSPDKQESANNSPGEYSQARSMLISENGFSGSSVNVLAGVKQSVYSDNNYQYAAFYDAGANLVVAKRSLDETRWTKKVTPFKGNVSDAHNYISLVVDGHGYIHLAWDHHNSKLKYARSSTPGGLEFEKPGMLAAAGKETLHQESSVTYPQFYGLKNGDILFAYRDGGSGRGNLILNRYQLQSQTWQRMHDSLLDGEGQRNAYWDMFVDINGVLHLAWIWRETPDVSSNHDIAYARSFDNGQTWQKINGAPYALPIVEGNADVVAVIPQKHKLMNPPVVSADSNSTPFIASYWADNISDAPRYRVIYANHNGQNANKSVLWKEIKAPELAGNFDLSGQGTKKPPISRAALLVESNSAKNGFHLIYRDDFNRGKVIASSVTNLDKPLWKHQVLVQHDMGAWEPSIDIAQWDRFKQAHLLLQQVGQADGNDEKSLSLEPSNIELLIWQAN